MKNKLLAHTIGSTTFVYDENSEHRSDSLTERIHQTGSQMLSIQQRIWDLDEEIRISQDKEQTEYIKQQNELRKQYAALRKEKEELESGKIKLAPTKLKGYVMTDDGYFIPRDDEPLNINY